MRVQGVGPRLASRAARVRTDVAFLLVDAALSLASYALVFAVTASTSSSDRRQLGIAAAAAIASHLLANAGFGLYGRVWRHASIAEARSMVCAGLAAAGVLAGLAATRVIDLPVAVIILGPAFATFLLGVSRFRARLFAWKRQAPGSAHPAIIIGSRDAGGLLIRELQNHQAAPFRPVAVVDPDVRSHGRLVHGIPVVGGIDDLPEVAAAYGAEAALFAISSAPSSLVRDAARAAELAHLSLRILPGLGERVRGVPSSRQLRDLRIEDLLGREQVRIDRMATEALIAGRRVLVTGGGGSIGSELVRQLASLDPAELVVLDHDETHLFESANRVRPLLGDRCVEALVDVRDRVDLLTAMKTHRPDIVFHAAAHKHVPMLERFPVEAARTNVLGTSNVVDAAVAAGVERLVFISSDKAVRPSSILGVSKWLGEQIVAERAEEGQAFCCVRFGNVLGSRGSVVPTFQRQIAEGGPVTVTSPDMTRYFMSVEEAVQLVLQAVVLTQRRDLFMLDMGQPVKIADLARSMIELAGYGPGEIEISFTGTRPGEKLVEELSAPQEQVVPTQHPSVHRLLPARMGVAVLEDGLHLLRRAVAQRDGAAAREVMFGLYRWAEEQRFIDLSGGPGPDLEVRTAPAGAGGIRDPWIH